MVDHARNHSRHSLSRATRSLAPLAEDVKRFLCDPGISIVAMARETESERCARMGRGRKRIERPLPEDRGWIQVEKKVM